MSTEARATPGLPGQAGPPCWTTELRREDDALDVLAEEWDDLAARCRTATFFQAAVWQRSWWRQYGRPGGLLVVLVRRDGRLVGAGAFGRRGVRSAA
ncbi:hypothetical protein ACFQ0M_33715 [Kitasatospora aburaviensis]